MSFLFPWGLNDFLAFFDQYDQDKHPRTTNHLKKTENSLDYKCCCADNYPQIDYQKNRF